jgi:hypothetical protein
MPQGYGPVPGYGYAPTPVSRKTKPLLVGLIVGLGLIGLAGSIVAGTVLIGAHVAPTSAPTATMKPTPSPTPLTHAVTGTLVLTDTSIYSSGITAGGGACEGSGGYSDLSAGVSVILKDENDKTIAATSLGEGVGATSLICTFYFTLSDVPDTATFYNIQISHRGTVSFSHADMVKNDWTIELYMGS